MSLPEAEEVAADDVQEDPEQDAAEDSAEDAVPEIVPNVVTEADIHELYRRAQLALNNGYTVARADEWAAEVGAVDGTPAALVEACEARLGIEQEQASSEDEEGEGKKEKKERKEEKDKKKDKDKDSSSAPASESEAPAEEMSSEGGPPADAEAEPATVADDALPEEGDEDSSTDDGTEYEGWSKRKLVDEAEARGLDVKSHMTKADIIALLRLGG